MLPPNSFGREPYLSDAMVYAHKQRLPVFFAKAQIGSAITGPEPAKECPIRSHDADASRSRGEDIALRIALHAVEPALAYLGGPLFRVHENLGLTRGTVVMDREDHPGIAIGHVKLLGVGSQRDAIGPEVPRHERDFA